VHGFAVPYGLPRPPLHQLRALSPPAEHVCASINRIPHHLNQIVIGGELPDDLLLLRILPNYRDVDSGISGPQEQLAGAPKLADFRNISLIASVTRSSASISISSSSFQQ